MYNTINNTINDNDNELGHKILLACNYQIITQTKTIAYASLN